MYYFKNLDIYVRNKSDIKDSTFNYHGTERYENFCDTLVKASIVWLLHKSNSILKPVSRQFLKSPQISIVRYTRTKLKKYKSTNNLFINTIT